VRRSGTLMVCHVTMASIHLASPVEPAHLRCSRPGAARDRTPPVMISPRDFVSWHLRHHDRRMVAGAAVPGWEGQGAWHHGGAPPGGYNSGACSQGWKTILACLAGAVADGASPAVSRPE